MSNKDELIQLLKNGFVDEFNETRPHDQNKLLDLSEIDLRDSQITGANLSNADLTGADFSESELSNMDFSNSDLSSVDCKKAKLQNCNFINATLIGTKLNAAQIADCDFTDADFSGTDLSEADLAGSDLCSALNLTACIFDGFTVWPEATNLPEDFETEYFNDLSALDDDEDDMFENDYAY